MYKNLRSKCFIKDLWCSPKILTRCIAKQLYGEKKRREYNCRKSVGTRAGLRDSRYSRTANTVHGAGGKGTQSGKFLEVLLALFTDTSTGRVEQTSKVWTSNCCWVEDGGSWHWLAEGRRGLGGSAEKETVGDLETAKENVLGRRRRRYFLHPCFSSHCGHIIFQIIVFHPAQSATWLLNLTHLDLCICHGLGPLPSGLGQE